MRLPLLALLLLPSAFSLNILMYVNVIGKSHVQFAVKLIDLLTERGHNVDLIMGVLNSLVELDESYNMRKLVVVKFRGESPWGKVATHLNDPFADPSTWDRRNLDVFKFVKITEAQCDLLLESPEIYNLLSSNQYDVAIINGYDFCPFAIAHHFKISPVLSYVPTPAVVNQLYYAGLPELPLYNNHVFESVNLDRSHFGARLIETLRIFRERYIHYLCYTAANAKIRARFGESFPDVRELLMNVSIDFTNSHPLLEEPRPLSHRLRYIGGIGLPTPRFLSADFDRLLNHSGKGTVIFSFGTQVGPEKISAEMQQVFVNTFKRFPEYTFLWKFDGFTQFNAPNVFNLKWLPQTDLPYDSRVIAFISHCGLNSFTEAAFAGVPIVAIPLFADQIHNAQRAQALGVAEILWKTEITEENLTRALRKMLYDEKYQLRAKEIAAMISELPDTPQRAFLEGVEYAAKFKNLPVHNRLIGANHNFLVQIGWDVAAFLTLVLAFVAYLIIRLIATITLKVVAFRQPKLKVS